MSIKSVDVDLNSLFNLTYSFDSLKLFLTNINENQQEMAKKIDELEKKLKKSQEQNEAFQKAVIQNQHVNDRKLKGLEASMKLGGGGKKEGKSKKTTEESPQKEKKKPEKNQPTSSDIQKTEEQNENKPATSQQSNEDGNKPQTEGEIQGGEVIKPLQIQDEEQRRFASANSVENEENKPKEKKEEEEENEDEEGYEFNEDEKSNFFQDSLEIEELKKRVTELEKKMKNNTNLMKFSNFGGSSGEDIEVVKGNVSNLQSLVMDHYKETDDIKKTLDEIKVKVEDFNVADLFKDAKIEGGSIDASKILIGVLENKVFKKFGLVDERLKKVEDTTFKVKTGQDALKNTQDSFQRIINQVKEDLKNLADLMQSTFGSTNDQINEVDTKFQEMFEKLKEAIRENEKKTKQNFDKLNEKLGGIDSPRSDELDKNLPSGLGEKELKFIKDINKKVLELERNIKGMNIQQSFNDLKKDIAKLQVEVDQRALQQDLYDLNDKVNVHSLKISEMKDNIDNLIKDSVKAGESINFILKRLELLNSAVNLLKAGAEGASQAGKQSYFDTTRFLEVSAFHDFVKRYERDLDRVGKETEDLRRYFNEMTIAIKKKAEEEDLRNLDASLNAKIEELRITCNRRFADKADTSKSIKYLDAQLKHIIEVYIKKMDKGDNWLLAKKPIGYQCASCEAYIGDLKDKRDEYLSWNKYPIREPQDKAYRIGNGFSRMLNMLSLDVKNSNAEPEGGNVSDGEDRRKAVNAALPTIVQKRGREEEVNKNANSDCEDCNGRASSPSGLIRIYRKNRQTTNPSGNLGDKPQSSG